MTEVLVASDSINVLGGPASITLNLDTGPEGQRGSYILYGLFNPNTAEAQETFISPPQVFDFYILIDPESANYMMLYQYVNQEGEFLWVPVVKLITSMYSTTRPTLFIDGEALITINTGDMRIPGISQIGTPQSPEIEDFYTRPGSSALFNVQISISNFNPEYVFDEELDAELYPVSYTYMVSDAYLDENDNAIKLPIKVVASEFAPSGTAPVDDKFLFVQMLITLQSPEHIEQFLDTIDPGGNS